MRAVILVENTAPPALEREHGLGLTECGTCVRYSCAVTGAPVAASRIHSRCPRGSKTMFGEVFGTRFLLPGLSVTYSNTYSSLHCL